MAFRIGGTTRRMWGNEEESDSRPVSGPLVMEQPLWPTIPQPHEVDRLFAQVFALVGEGIAGATHALLAGDRQAAKELVQRDEVIDRIISEISQTVQHELVHGETTAEDRRELVAILRMLPDMERNGDLAEHIARRAARGLGTELSARSRGLVERMGEVATHMWRATTDAHPHRPTTAAAGGGGAGNGRPLLRAIRGPCGEPGEAGGRAGRCRAAKPRELVSPVGRGV